MKRFARFLLAQDRLGTKFSLGYNGTFNTWLVTLLSFAINVLVLIILVQRTAEVFLLNDPTVMVITRSIFKDEIEELGELSRCLD